MCLRDDLHRAWTEGRFAPRPLDVSHDNSTMMVELHWLPKPLHGPNDDVHILSAPPSSRSISSVAKTNIMIELEDGTIEKTATGRVFEIHTEDPVHLPLPSKDLLEMAWFLTRIVSLSAAAEDKDLDFDDSEYHHEGSVLGS